MPAQGNYIYDGDVDNWADLTATITGTGIAFNDNTPSADTITDTGTGFLTAGFVAGMRILISGSTSNDALTYMIASVVAGTITLISTDELTDELAGATVTITSGERQETIERIENLIEQITKDRFYAKAFVIYKNGNDNDQLFLGLIPDILTVTEILISGVELTSSWWTYNANSVYLDPEAVTVEAGDRAELHLRLKYKRKLFPKGIGNIKITGTMGWSSCPLQIKKAAVMLCQAENDITLYPGYGSFKSEKLGDYSYTRGEQTKVLSGIDRIDKLLYNFIRRKPMMGAV